MKGLKPWVVIMTIDKQNNDKVTATLVQVIRRV
jgi:hypothetical protein